MGTWITIGVVAREISDLRRLVCPRCRRGRIFSAPVYRAPLAMFERCDSCGLRYEREQGYFLGAMYVSYGLSIPPILLMVLALWLGGHWPLDWCCAIAFLIYLPFVPLVARYSRAVWMYLDQRFDPR